MRRHPFEKLSHRNLEVESWIVFHVFLLRLRYIEAGSTINCKSHVSEIQTAEKESGCLTFVYNDAHSDVLKAIDCEELSNT